MGEVLQPVARPLGTWRGMKNLPHLPWHVPSLSPPMGWPRYDLVTG